MSDSWLKFVPRDPAWQPSAEVAETAANLLRGFAPSGTVKARLGGQVEFVDPGGNWSGVRCPSCGAGLDEWWPGAMDLAFESGFRDLRIVTPCCGVASSLNDLDYVREAAFASFVLEVMNPGLDTTPQQERALAECLGAPLKKIRVHL